MNWVINLLSKVAGATGVLSKYMPLVGGASAVLIGVGHILAAVNAAGDPASIISVVKGAVNSPDGAAVAAGIGVIVQHFKHQDMAAVVASNVLQNPAQ